MALKKLNWGVSDLTSGLLRDAEINLQQERPAVLFQNEQLNKHNAILASQNAQLQAEAKELQNIINQWAPIVKQAQEIPELLVTLGKEKKKGEILQQQLDEAKFFIAAANIPGLQQQLRAKDDEIQKLQSQLETAKKAPKAPPPATSAICISGSSAGDDRSAGKVCHSKSAIPPVRTANTKKPKASRTGPLAGPMERFMYLHKLAREMELFHMEPEEFCHWAKLTTGFDMDMCRTFVKYIRKEAKCQSYRSILSFLDECRKDMEKFFSIPRMSRKNNAR